MAMTKGKWKARWVNAAMAEAWFKPKRFGYGAVPINWKGWVASTVFAVVLSGLGIAFAVLAKSEASPIYLATCLGLIGLVTVGFVRIARARTDGEWRWRWGRQISGSAPFARERPSSQL